MDSHSIYSLLMSDDFHHKHYYEHFPEIERIDVKRIQNVKALLTSTASGNVLLSSFSPDMSEIDGRQFLQYQSVKPVTLVFATNPTLHSFASIGQCMLKRLNICGKAINVVCCVYAVSERDVKPAAWILLDQISSLSYQFNYFKSKLRECNNNCLGVVSRTNLVGAMYNKLSGSIETSLFWNPKIP